MRTTELVTCSQTSSRPSLSIVIPLPLLDGLATSLTPEPGSQRRRTSPGMSLNSRYPAGFQIGPSVKVNPVPSCSSSASSSTSSRKAGAWTCTAIGGPLLHYRLPRPRANVTGASGSQQPGELLGDSGGLKGDLLVGEVHRPPAQRGELAVAAVSRRLPAASNWPRVTTACWRSAVVPTTRSR